MTRKHLLGIQDLDREEILEILDTAESFQEVSTRPIKKVPTLRGKTIINLFFEASTRTRTSFEIAGKRLSADVVNISSSTSSVSKGETLIDTARTLDAMAADCVIVRHPASGAPHTLAKLTRACIINGGDGAHEHPTQALHDADVVMMLRVQFERMSESFFPSVREYFRYYGLTRERAARAKSDVIIMHPGPMNRGVEIASDVADGAFSVILDQVSAGVAVRMAILFLLLGG